MHRKKFVTYTVRKFKNVEDTLHNHHQTKYQKFQNDRIRICILQILLVIANLHELSGYKKRINISKSNILLIIQ